MDDDDELTPEYLEWLKEREADPFDADLVITVTTSDTKLYEELSALQFDGVDIWHDCQDSVSVDEVQKVIQYVIADIRELSKSLLLLGLAIKQIIDLVKSHHENGGVSSNISLQAREGNTDVGSIVAPYEGREDVAVIRKPKKTDRPTKKR